MVPGMTTEPRRGGARTRGSRRRRSTWRPPSWLVWVALAGLVVVLGVHARHYYPFFSDDALISLRYAERLASGRGLTWTDGERVEGYSDLLWILLLAPFSAAGLPTITTARVLDFLGAVAGIALVSCAARPFRPRLERALGGGLALALAAPVAVWSIAGLEHGAMIGTLVAALLLTERAVGPTAPAWRPLLLAGAALAALVLFRIDGFVLAGAVGVGALLARRPWRRGEALRAARTLAWLAALPAVALAGQAAFRLAYYGAWLPNTAVAKVSLNVGRLLLGWQHVRTGYGAILPMVLLALVGAGVSLRRAPRGRVAIPLTVALAWTGYLILIGGDIFPGWRQLLLALVALATLIAEGAAQAAPRLGLGPVVATTVPVLLLTLPDQLRDLENIRARHERWEWDGLSIGHLLRTTVGDRAPLLAVDAAGALPYWSGLPSLDMLGLNDAYIAHHPPASFGKGGIGHELGDGDYVLRRAPDIIAFNNAAGYRKPQFLSGRQMLRRPEFTRNYQLVPVVGRIGNRAAGDLFIRREGGKLSVVRSEAGLEIPGWFFASDRARATLGRHGDLVTPVSDAVPGDLPPLEVPAGTYRLHVEPADAGLRVGVRCHNLSPHASEGDAAVLELARKQSLRILVAPPPGATIELRSVRLERVVGARAGRRCPGSSSRDPLEVTLASVTPRKAPQSYWGAPDNVVMGGSGVRVVLPSLRKASQVELSVDSNDQYRVRFFAGEAEQGTVLVAATRGTHDLVVHRLEVPEPARTAGFDRVEIVPVTGDRSYSLGHLVIL